MSSTGHFVMMNFATSRFYVYFGDINDPNTWKFTEFSFDSLVAAENKAFDLDSE